MDDREFLENIKNGKTTIDDGVDYLKNLDYQDMNFAKIDFQRKKDVDFLK